MLHYSFSSVYMAFFASNLLLIILALCFKNEKIRINAGYKLLLLFVYCTLLRFLIPFEFSFSQNILMPEPLSFLVSRVRHPLFTIANYEFTVWTILLAIWIVGFLVHFVKFINLRKEGRYLILSSCLDVTETAPYQTTLAEVCAERGKRNCFRILEVYGLDSPMIYGVFKPQILIPENWNVSENTLRNTISHEISHHYHHDLLTKNLVHLLCIIYWWNPFGYLLCKQADIILEMRIDHSVTKSDSKAVSDYIKCLIEVKAYKAKIKESLIPDVLTLSFAKVDEVEIRSEMLAQSKKPKKILWNIALAILVFGIYILSYVFIFEAHYISPETKNDLTELTSDNTYAIQKADGTYDIYFGSYFMENVDTLEYYSSDIPIYTEEKEINNEKD